MRRFVTPPCLLLTIAVLASLNTLATAQEAPIAEPKMQLDPPLPPGTTDSIEQRMAIRRAQQAQQGLQPNGGFGPGAVTGGFGGGPGGPGAAGFARGQPGFSPEAVLKKLAPVSTGIDPKAIEESDKIITHIIPLQNINATSAVNDLRPHLSADADVSAVRDSNSVVITDQAVRVRRVVDMLQQLDRVAASRPAAGRGAAADAPRGTFLGTVRAAGINIRTTRAGTIAQVLVKDGQAVKKGALLFKLDGTEAQAALGLAQKRVAALELAAATRAKENKDDRLDQLLLEEARAQLKARQLDLDATEIRSPLDGTVTSCDLEPGAYVAQGEQLTRVVEMGNQFADFRLNGADMPTLKVGQKLAVQRWPLGQPSVYESEVTYVAPEVTESGRVFTVKLPPTGSLKPGMTVTLNAAVQKP